MSKEEIWKKKRLGMITASELGEITSAKGGIIETNLSYIRKKRWERLHGFTHPVSARPMDIGNEQEPYICEWVRKNLGFPEIIYSKELDEIPFWVAKDCPVGASPDAYIPDETVEFEFKTLVGATSIEFFGDPDTSYEEKKLAVWKDHGDQLLGQFISKDSLRKIYVVKYIYQDDDILEDTDSPLEQWRGLVFQFGRDDYAVSIEEMKARIRLIDAMISSHTNPSEFKKGEWYVNGSGVLKKKEK